jgi:2-dehydropantoate 2-reductase
LVGAGAVGQVYGRHLQRGGAEVSFLVKPAHREAMEGGVTMYPLNRNKNRKGVRFEGYGLLTDPAAIGAQPWDQVWLCVSATALRGAWLEEAARRSGQATLVLLAPGLDDRAYVCERAEESRLVQGVISFTSWQAPLLTERLSPPGVAYWFPPFAPSPFAGEPERVGGVVSTLVRGGCPAKRSPGAVRGAVYASAVMMPYLLALEAEAWSFQRLKRSARMALAGAASRQALGVVARQTGTRPPWTLRLARPALIRWALALAPRLMPFDLETFLAYHFTKVGDQTRMMVRTYVERGREHAQPVEALEELLALLPPP